MVRFNNPDLQQFLEDEVRAGRYASVDAAIEEAVRQMKTRFEHLPDLDPDLEERVVRAEAQHAQGGCHTIEHVRAHFAAKAKSSAKAKASA